MRTLYETSSSLLYETSLNEMSRINKNEHGNKWWNLNFNIYDVVVIGEGQPNKYAHCHIKHRSNGWEIRVLPDGTIHSIKTKGKGMMSMDDAKKFEKITKEWVKQKNVVSPTITNGEVIQNTWIMNN